MLPIFFGFYRGDSSKIPFKATHMANKAVTNLGLEFLDTDFPYTEIAPGTIQALETAPLAIEKDGVIGFEDQYEFVSVKEILDIYDLYCQQTNIDPNLLIAQAKLESGFNPNARSHSGALGWSQFIKGTWRSVTGTEPENRLSIKQSVEAQCRLMYELFQRNNGSWESAMYGYLGARKKSYCNTIFGIYNGYLNM